MTVVNVWAGRLTHEGVRVIAKLSGVASARLAVDTDPAFGSPEFFGPITPDGQDVVRINATGLDPATTYFYAIEEDSVLDTATTGSFTTFDDSPGNPVSFAFAATGDAGASPDFPDTTGQVLASNRVANPPVCDDIRLHAKSPRFCLHMGDITYYDLGSGSHGIVGGGSLDNYRRMYDDVLLQSRQHELYRNVPIWHCWDDHDYGPNNSDGTLADKQNAADAYREKVPSETLVDTGAIYQRKQIGRVLLVMLDTRFYRSPNSDPDGPDKTMLGEAQKDWLADVLAASSAEVLILISSVRWLNGSEDSWPGFVTERQEIADLLIEGGWADRMVMLNADAHTVAMDSGSNNHWGGFPVYVSAPLDAGPSSITSGYDIGISNQRAQYSIVEVIDNGSRITITTTGYQNDDVLFGHVFAVETEEEPEPGPEPEPEPTRPEVAIAEIRNRVTWLGCRLGDGRVIAELPDITGTVSRVLGRYTSASLQTPIPRGGPSAVPLDTVLQAMAPARTMIVAVVNDIPTWAGIPLPRRRGTPATMRVGCVSVEGYLRHRSVRNHTWRQEDEASVIAAGLLADAGDIAGVGNGINLIIDAPPTGRLRDRTYLASDRKTVYAALTELMGVRNGPEWTIDLDWTDSTMTAVALIARVRSRIGVAAANPSAIFETTADSVFASQGAADATYELLEDFSERRYGNYVVAYSSGEGEDQPASTPAIDTAALAAGSPIWERHFQPSSSIIEVDTLNDHAVAELARVKDGLRNLTIAARWSSYPRYGVDWRLGDDIGWDLVGHGHPDGFTGQGRAIGFELDTQAGVIRPLLQEDV